MEYYRYIVLVLEEREEEAGGARDCARPPPWHNAIPQLCDHCIRSFRGAESAVGGGGCGGKRAISVGMDFLRVGTAPRDGSHAAAGRRRSAQWPVQVVRLPPQMHLEFVVAKVFALSYSYRD